MSTRDSLELEGRYCSFCGRHNTDTDVDFMIAGPPNTNAAICDICIDVVIEVYHDFKSSDRHKKCDNPQKKL